jgi:hypothetical protein
MSTFEDQVIEALKSEVNVLKEDANNAMAGMRSMIKTQRNTIEKMRAALEPFARNVDALSLSKALGHIEREHLWAARKALANEQGGGGNERSDRTSGTGGSQRMAR